MTRILHQQTGELQYRTRPACAGTVHHQKNGSPMLRPMGRGEMKRLTAIAVLLGFARSGSARAADVLLIGEGR